MRTIASKRPQGHEEPVQSWTALEESVTTSLAATLSTPDAWARNPQALRDAIDQGVRQGLAVALQASADRWAEEVLGAARYERTSARVGERSGTRSHTFHFRFGPVSIEVPKPRRGASRPEWVPALKAKPSALLDLARQLWLRGLSTRDLEATSAELGGRKYSHSSIAAWVRDVSDDVLRWLNRPVSANVRYLVLDALYVPVVRESASKEPILVALGITKDGHKEILDVMNAPSESADSWGTILSRLKLRGLRVDDLQLVITDGDEGLLSAVRTHLPSTPRQRCSVHKVRNVIGRCPKDLKKTAPAEAAAIYKAPSRAEARRRAQAFIAKYESDQPKLAAIIRDDLDATLTFYEFDPGKWPGLRSTNALERINRELRRKFREVGAMGADINVTRIAVQVAGFVNQDMKERPIDGFGRPRRRGSRKRQSAPSS